MRYSNDGEVSVQNHITNYEFKVVPVMSDNVIIHKETKRRVIESIKSMK